MGANTRPWMSGLTGTVPAYRSGQHVPQGGRQNPGGHTGTGVCGVYSPASCLLAAVTLQKIHRVDGNCVSADIVAVVVVAVVVHSDPPQIFVWPMLLSADPRPFLPPSAGGSPLYNLNDTHVIPLHVVFRRVVNFFARLLVGLPE